MMWIDVDRTTTTNVEMDDSDGFFDGAIGLGYTNHDNSNPSQL